MNLGSCGPDHGGFTTVRDLAQRWAVEPRTVQKWIAAGILEGTRIGPKCWRVTIHEAERFETSQRLERAG